jgi:hypothetical protein
MHERLPPPSAPGEGAPVAIRVQILAGEHWSLLATRGMTYNEIFSRTGIFLTVVSASVASRHRVHHVPGVRSSAQGSSVTPRTSTYAGVGYVRLEHLDCSLLPKSDGLGEGVLNRLEEAFAERERSIHP